MQDYGNPASRNTMRAAGGMMKNAGPVGSNQEQGRGELPAKVNVPVPGTNTTQPAYKGGMAKAPAGFNNGIIPGKI